MFTFASSKSGSAVRLSCRPSVRTRPFKLATAPCGRFLYVIYFEAVSPVDYNIYVLNPLF